MPASDLLTASACSAWVKLPVVGLAGTCRGELGLFEARAQGAV